LAIECLQEKRRLESQARTDFLTFLASVWWKPWPLQIGRHTATVALAIDEAISAFLAGQSSNLDVEIPFRHGKSDMVSRALIPYFLGRCLHLHPDVILSGYGDNLVQGFSKEAKGIIASRAYRSIFPGVSVAAGSDSAAEWRLVGSSGLITAAGLGGSLTGKGAHLLIVDDYCKNRAEARSETFRRNQWESFGDAMTRRAPVSIALLCATSWHIDDCRGRLRETEGKDDAFPRFKRLSFPARNKDGSFLFPERFPASWYLSQYATLGAQWASALLDCSPVADSGNRFRVDLVREEDISSFPEGRYIRAWDLASSKKERDKDSPDFTVGTLGIALEDSEQRKHLWIKDLVMGQWEAPERNKRILAVTEQDGQGVPVAIEAFGAYKDAYTEMVSILRGRRTVTASRLPGDKSAKLAELEPIFEVGNVHVPRGAPWLEEWRRQFKAFPNGKHDDACDSAAICYYESLKPGTFLVPYD